MIDYIILVSTEVPVGTTKHLFTPGEKKCALSLKPHHKIRLISNYCVIFTLTKIT